MFTIESLWEIIELKPMTWPGEVQLGRGWYNLAGGRAVSLLFQTVNNSVSDFSPPIPTHISNT